MAEQIEPLRMLTPANITDGYCAAGAVVSACGKYRYRLWREWRSDTRDQWDMWTEDDGSPALDGAGVQIGEPKSCVFVMLNPSTADAEQDDPTIRRCVGFARAWGYDRLEVINLFAFRATSPKDLLALGHNDDPVGPDNQRHVSHALLKAGIIVCAWGANGAHLGQDETMLGWIEDDAHALQLTKNGHPSHPLYLPSALKPFEWDGRR